MSAHRRARETRQTVRRTSTAAILALASGAGFIAAAGPAAAAGPWYVAPPTASPAGANTASCGLAAATPCATVTFVLAKAAFVSGDTINVAPGVYTDRPAITAKGATITGAGAGVVFDGGTTSWAIAVNGAAPVVNLNNLTLRNGGFSGGGALPIVTSTVNATNVNVINSKGQLGGGIAVYGTATLNMTGGSITGNTATAAAALGGVGGGLYVVGKTATVAAGTAVLDGVTISGNIANGAAQAAGGNGGGVFNAGTTTIRNSTLTGNQAVASTNASNARRGFGGAVMNGPQDGVAAPVLTISNSTIAGGTVAGGANSTYGGAIANGESFGGPAPVTTATGVTMTGNTAVLGGAVSNGAKLNVTGGAINGSAAYSGAGVWNVPSAVPAAAGVTATFDGTSFADNTANGLTLANYGNGGAIFNSESLTVKNATFTGNKAVASSAGGTATGWGGAIWNGAFAANDAPVATITGTTITGTGTADATIAGGIANPGNVFGFAGALPGALAATGLTIDNEAALAGGGMYTGGATTLTDSTIKNSRATHASAGFGGGLYASRSAGPVPVLTLDNTDLTGNSAAVVGGGLAQLFGVTTQIRNGSSVDDNSAAISAGGIYNAGDLTVRGSDVSGNDAAFQGGGIYNGSSTATDTPSLVLADSTVDDNTAANSAGGLVTLKGATLTATGGHVNGNSALAGGGAVVGDNATASFDGTDFRGNTATSIGGGALVNAGSATIRNSELTGNEAVHTTGNTGLGGAVYSGSNNDGVSTSLRIEASTLAGNKAYGGAALLTYSPGAGVTNKASITGSTITANESSSTLGAIEQFHPLTITSSTVTDNTAAAGGYGGLALVVPSTVGIAGTVLAGNTGNECSGPVLDGGYNHAPAGDTSCGFTPGKHDQSGDPGLGALADNGGPTRTQLPSPASALLGKVPAATATSIFDAISGAPVALCGAGTTDQRGTGRPQGAQCDIGSVEADQVAPTVNGPADADYSVGVLGAALTYTATGSPRPALTVVGSLPTGVTFTDNGDGTGTVSGTPAASTGGSYAVTVKASNEAGSDSTPLTLVVHQAPVLSGPAGATYTVGQPGGPTTFTQTSGHPTAVLSSLGLLPGGIGFTDHGDGTGSYAGTPASGTGGTYPLTVKGANGTGPDATAPFTLTVNEATALTGPGSAAFTVGTAGASGEYTGTGFPVPTLTVDGLPAGLGLVGTGTGTATISGTAANGTGGEYEVVVKAANGVGDPSTRDVHVTVTEAPELTGPGSAHFVEGDEGAIAYSSDGYPAATVSIAGDLPSGLSFHATAGGGGTITGTPGAGTSGTYPITVRASNGIDPDALVHLSLVVAPPVEITTSSLPGASVGTGYGATVVAEGGTAPYVFTVSVGSLPAGLTLASNGQISGTPTGPAGTSTFTVKVTDSATDQHVDTQQLSITVGKGTTTLAVDPVLLQVTTQLGVKVNLALLQATLTGGTPAQPVANQTIVFKVGATTVCTALTDAQGKVKCQPSVANSLLVVLGFGVSAVYGGNGTWNGSSGSAGLIGS